METRHVLFIGPDEDLQRQATSVLSQQGYAVSLVARPEDVPAALAESDPAVVLLELSPDEETYARMAADFLRRNLEPGVVVIAGLSNLDGALEAVRQGAAGYLLKPVQPHELLRVVERSAQNTQLARENRLLRRRLHELIDSGIDSARAADGSARLSRDALYRLLQTLAEWVPAPLALINGSGTVVVWNERATAQTGQRCAGGTWRSCLRKVVPDRRLRHRLLSRLRDALSEGPWLQVSVEWPMASDSLGKLRIFALREHPGDAASLLLLGETRGGDQQRGSLEQRSQGSRVDEKFVAGLAHRLNDPLASLVVSAELLLDDETLAADTRRRLQMLVQEARRCSDVMQHAVGVVRNAPPPSVLTDINRTVRDALADLEDELESAGVRFTLSLSSGTPPVPVPRERLHAVLAELFTALVLACRQSGGRHTLRLRTQPSRRSVYVVVEIPQSWLRSGAHETEADRHTEGEGVHQVAFLDQAAAVAKALGGDLRVSRLSETTTAAILRLPIAEVGSRGRLDGRPRRPMFSGQRVLVVDDEEVILELLQAVLGRWGLQVDIAADGAEAVQKIQSQPFDLILSDIKMPNLDGKGLYAEVQRIRPQLARRIIFSTGDTASDQTASFLDEVGNPYLTKPFDMDDLRRTISKTLVASPSPEPHPAP